MARPEDQQVAGGGDGQELRQPLQDAEQRGASEIEQVQAGAPKLSRRDHEVRRR